MINESLQPGDLDHLVLPLISVDEFSSKIDNRRAIVVAFYCTDKQPAEDLMRFIEGSNLDILDTEVSPAPSTEGYYVVFVEFSRNRDFPEILDDIINQVGNVAHNKWQLKAWNHADIVHYSVDLVKQFVILNPALIPPDPEDDTDPVKDVVAQAQSEPQKLSAQTPAPQPVAENIFWSQADIDRVVVSENQIVFRSGDVTRAYATAGQVEDFGKLNLEESLNVQALRKLLGHQYQVYMYEHGIVVQRGSEYRVLKES